MLYCFWDMARDGCNFYFSFLSIFCPFTPLQPKNWKIQKNENTPGDITSFYTSVPKIMIKCSIVPETWCMTDVIVIFHLGGSFKVLLALTLKDPFISESCIERSVKIKICFARFWPDYLYISFKYRRQPSLKKLKNIRTKVMNKSFRDWKPV